VRHKPRPLIVSLVLPYVNILLLGVGFLVMTAIASLLQSMSDDQLVLLGRGWSLDRLSVVLLYLKVSQAAPPSLPPGRCK
jgi:hypothetical protein